MDGNPDNPITTEVDSGLAASGQSDGAPVEGADKTTKKKKSKKEKSLNDLALTFSVFAVVAVLMTVLGLATYVIGSGMIGWVCEICASFRAQLAVFLLICTVATIFVKPFRIVALTCFASALLNILLISPVLDFNKAEKKDSTFYTFKVLGILVDTPALKLEDVAKFADKKDTEIVVYTDMNLTKVARMNAKMNQYVHKSALPHAENKGAFIYSQFPLKGSRLVEVGDDKVPVTITTAFFETGWVNLVGFQAPKPDTAENFDKRNAIFEAVSKVVADLKGPTIVCANLNATPYSGAYHKFLSDSKLKSLRDNLSVKTNWYCGPADVLLNRFPVDNIFVNDKVSFIKRSVLDMNLSKVTHKPIMGEFSVSNKDEKYTPPKLESKPKAPAVAPPGKTKKETAKATKKKVKKKSKRRSRGKK